MTTNIHYIEKDITTVEKGIIAHGCNCQGVMGSGVAFFLKEKYPQIFLKYKELCDKSGESLLGLTDFVHVHWNEHDQPDIIVANCFTQNLYGKNGKYAIPDAIYTSLYEVCTMSSVLSKRYDTPYSVYIPKIGAGRGGLDWTTEVEPIIRILAIEFNQLNIYVCSWAE